MAPVFMSEKTYQKLPEDLRSIVLKCIQEASVYERQQDLQINEKALEQLKPLGCLVNADVDKDSFISRLKGVQDETAAQLKVQNILALIRKTRP
jgi:TRAP-type C4-dicarboxylate transport system substrate-binding protein